MTRDDIKSIRMTVGSWGKVLGYASVTLTCGLTIDSIKVMDGKTGPWIALPQVTRKDKEKNEMVFQNCISFEDEDARDAFLGEIMRKYESSKKGTSRGETASGDTATSPGEETPKRQRSGRPSWV